jgi:hypothetical protein
VVPVSALVVVVVGLVSVPVVVAVSVSALPGMAVQGLVVATEREKEVAVLAVAQSYPA